ncbi:hypothetical protein QBC47DRAFT_13658 [Echria macrotheca]|uniref:Secreted protein n=1 Tax=Echria macrotheca TaxID=438768 RepID=A0AAJ0BM00_9PEZI|nr:hypothetical protein QBC47DRAFT_13658 [Echria macrotheca]
MKAFGVGLALQCFVWRLAAAGRDDAGAVGVHNLAGGGRQWCVGVLQQQPKVWPGRDSDASGWVTRCSEHAHVPGVACNTCPTVCLARAFLGPEPRLGLSSCLLPAAPNTFGV